MGQRNYYNIQRNVGVHGVKGKNRREGEVLKIMRIGHTRLNTTLLLIGKRGTDGCEYGKQKVWNVY